MPKTQIFASYEEFHARQDKTTNGVSPRFVKRNANWQEMNETNTGCWDCEDCANCKDCEDCTECEACEKCADCDGCKNCYNCEHCYKCKNCKNCIMRKDCNNCTEKRLLSLAEIGIGIE